MRILHLEPECYPPELLDRLRKAGPVDVLEDSSQATLLRRLEDTSYQAVFARLGCTIDRRVFDLQPELRFVVTPTTGLNHIDVEEAERRGVRVVSLAGETAFLETIRSTAEHTWALLLALLRRVPPLADRARSGVWQRAGWKAEELDGKALGIVGCGRVGKMVAGYGAAFGMRVIGFDRKRSACDEAPYVEYQPLDELLASSDVVSLHITGSSENTGFLDAERIQRMKAGAVLVNTARGEIVDEAALLAALESGSLAGAALDVLAGDSSWDRTVPEDHPLIAYARDNDNLLITPHVAGYSHRSISRTRAFVTERFLALSGAVTDESLDTPSWADAAQ